MLFTMVARPTSSYNKCLQQTLSPGSNPRISARTKIKTSWSKATMTGDAMADVEHPGKPLTIRMHERDNVAIVANDGGLPAGFGTFFRPGAARPGATRPQGGAR
jgi:hypothetical protein